MEKTKNGGRSFDWGNRKTIMDNKQCRRNRGTEFIYVKAEKIKRNIFSYAIGGGNTGHPAVFPEKLAEDQILSWTNKGDVVFDHFVGSGTTAKMAFLNGRHYIGFEISKEYCEISRNRVKNILL